ncbi:hypothetical protein D9M68_86450 [compost metagenome]|jgi:hypothetical protein
MGRSCGPLEGKRRRPYPSHGLPRLPIPYSGEAPESACSYDPANSLIRRRFKDSVNPQCTGKALMRDALMVNQKKISNLIEPAPATTAAGSAAASAKASATKSTKSTKTSSAK